ncbi:helix-turn-helix domain-containing protein [Paenibacillus sp. HB172176]|uniref:helix-turn-helix domain-containing protein n=1 Tax=Paenibacillus sp. HB172176 TaxID=2493690 RepID=UPI00143ACB11|nr:helix-turn-helix domain-containing protein [Paenibacillus sp. HB172176]
MRGLIRNGYWTKLMSFGLILAIVPVLVVGILSYEKASSTVKDKVINGNQLSLELIHSKVEKELKWIDQFADKLLNSNAVQKTLPFPLGDRYEDAQRLNDIEQQMNYFRSFEIDIKEIILVNLQQKWLVGSGSSLGTFLRYEPAELSSAYPNLQQFIASGKSSYWETQNDRSVLLYRRVPAFDPNPSGAVIVRIASPDISEFRGASEQFGEVLILDKDSRIVASSAEDSSDSFDEALIDRLSRNQLELHGDKGIIERDLDRQRVGITYTKSSFNDWTYVSLVSIYDLNADSRSIGWFTAVTCIGIILLFCCFSLLGSRRMYAPINRLYRQMAGGQQAGEAHNELETISRGVQSMFSMQQRMTNQLKPYFMAELCEGRLKPSEIGRKMKDWYSFAAAWREQYVLIVRIDTLMSTHYQSEDLDLLLFAISNMTLDLFPEGSRLDPVVMERTVVLVLSVEGAGGDSFNRIAYEKAKALAREVMRYLKLEVSIGISAPYSELERTADAYREAAAALHYRIREEAERILFYDELNEHASRLPVYPIALEAELLNAIKAGSGETGQKLGEFLDELFRLEAHHQVYSIFLARLLANLLRSYQEAGAQMQYDKSGSSLFQQLFELNAKQDIRMWLQASIIDPLLEHINRQRERAGAKLSGEVLKLVHEHLLEDISLDFCAERLNYHPVYISRAFRQETGMNFSDYVARQRLELAKAWLRETDMTVAEIAEKLKYANARNFIRYFKKMEGDTPGSYRNRRKANK